MKKIFLLYVCIFLLWSNSVNAGLITSAGSSFNDLGGSTIDMQSNLEWMDFSSDTRSQCSVMQDTGSGVLSGCSSFDGLDLIDDSAGWRYATHTEFATLLSNWSGLAIPEFGFISIGGFRDTFLDVFAGGSTNMRADLIPYPPATSTNNLQATGFNIGLINVNTNFFNGNINSAHPFSAALVRSSASVPIPTTLVLFCLGFAGLGIVQRKKV